MRSGKSLIYARKNVFLFSIATMTILLKGTHFKAYSTLITTTSRDKIATNQSQPQLLRLQPQQQPRQRDPGCQIW